MAETLEINLSDKIIPKYKEYLNDILDNKYSEIVLTGGRGTTKSSFYGITVPFGMMEDYYVNGEITHCVALRKIGGTTVENSVFNQFKWGVDQLGVSHLWNFIKNPYSATFLPSGQKVFFSGCDDPIKLKSIKFPKGYIKYRIFEEFNQFENMKEIRNLNQSFVRGGNSMGFYVFNPEPSSNAWSNIEMMKEVDGRLHIHNDYTSVPVEWLGSQFIKDAERLKKENFKAYQNEYLGLVTGEGGEVFKNIKSVSLSDKEIKQYENFRHGLDFGFTDDPSCFIRLVYLKKHRKIIIFDEIFEYGMSTRELSEKIVDKVGYYEVIKADSQERRTINTMQQEYFLHNVEPCQKGADSVRHGIQWLANLKSIEIDRKRCPNTFMEFSTYELKKNKQGKTIKQYPDEDNHSIDAARYALDDIILKTGWRVGK